MALSEEEVEAIAEQVLHGSQERYVAELMNSAVDRFSAAARAMSTSGTAEVMLGQLARDWPETARKILAAYEPAISEETRKEVSDALGASLAQDEAALVTFSTAAAATQAERYASLGLTEGFAARAEAAAEGVASIVRRQNVLMEQAAERLWYDVCEDAVNRAVLGTATTDEIIARAVARLGDIGYIPYGRGGEPTVSNMADVAVRRHVVTQTAQAGGRLTIGLLDSYGHDLVITDAHWGARPEHAEWQGKPCALHGAREVDGVKYPDIRDLTGYGTVTGLHGANCRHTINPYYPGVTPLPDRDFGAMEEHFGMTSQQYYEATQRQRAWERRIRKTKREIAAMERAGIGLESPAYVQKRLVLGRQQQSLARHCADNKLVRQPAREKAYGVSRQPRALRSAGSASGARRRAFRDHLGGLTPQRSKSEFMNAKSPAELERAVDAKYGVNIVNAAGLDFKSVKEVCAGIDDVLSDFPKAKSWLSLKAGRLGGSTVAEVGASGTVTIDAPKFVAARGDALAIGRHEAGHLLEVAMCDARSDDPEADYKSGRHSRRVLNNALRKYREATGSDAKIDKLVDRISAYPGLEGARAKSRGVFYSEGLAEIVMTSYNGKAKANGFEDFVLDELRRELS